MRTGHTLFNELTETQEAPSGIKIRKGRSEELLAQRDDRLIHRYLYYLLYTELRQDVINQHLEEEFDLTGGRILTIIYTYASEIRKLRQNPPTILQLRSKYPHLVWIATK
jgi:hypothetical protein